MGLMDMTFTGEFIFAEDHTGRAVTGASAPNLVLPHSVPQHT